MPPAIAAKTICSDTATPDTTSGFTYWMYCVSSAPPSAVSAALITVTRNFSRITLMPIEAAAILVLGDRLERDAADAGDRSRCQTASPATQTDEREAVEGRLARGTAAPARNARR